MLFSIAGAVVAVADGPLEERLFAPVPVLTVKFGFEELLVLIPEPLTWEGWMVVGNASRAVTDIGGTEGMSMGGRVRGESSNKRCAGMVGELSSTGRVISTSAEPLPAAEDDQEAGLSLLSTSSRISSKGTSIVGRGTLKRSLAVPACMLLSAPKGVEKS